MIDRTQLARDIFVALTTGARSTVSDVSISFMLADEFAREAELRNPGPLTGPDGWNPTCVCLDYDGCHEVAETLAEIHDSAPDGQYVSMPKAALALLIDTMRGDVSR